MNVAYDTVMHPIRGGQACKRNIYPLLSPASINIRAFVTRVHAVSNPQRKEYASPQRAKLDYSGQADPLVHVLVQLTNPRHISFQILEQCFERGDEERDIAKPGSAPPGRQVGGAPHYRRNDRGAVDGPKARLLVK